MLVVTRFRVPEEDAGPAGGTVEGFRADLERAHEVLAAQRGYEGGRLGRNLDEPSLWTMVTWWRDVGSYRRALSTYDVKVGAVPLLSRAIDEPSAFESLEGDLNRPRPRQT